MKMETNNTRLFSKNILKSAAVLLGYISLSLSINVLASERVISAGSSITELVIALNASDKLVAVDLTSQVPSHLAVDRLGYHRALSAEGILALSPSLVIGSDAMGPKRTLDILTAAGVDVVQLSDAQNQTDLTSNVSKLGKLLNKTTEAQILNENIEALSANIYFKRSQLEGHEPRVLFMLLQPDRPARVGGLNSAADTIIKLAGGHNAAEFKGYKSLSQEGILALKPNVILVSKRSETDDFSAQEVLDSMPLLSHTPAGEKGNIIALSPQALIGGLGLTALDSANELADKFLSMQGVVIPLTAKAN